MKKKILSMLLTLALLCSSVTLFSLNLVAEEHLTEVPNGYTPIYSEADLVAVNNGLGGKYILMKDIDLTKGA